MKITHIYHSGFMLEMEESVLLFDWYKGKLPEIPAGKHLYVFCSHAHEDHYSPMIWDLQKIHDRITYILDSGIPDAVKHPETEVVIVEPHRTCTLPLNTDPGEGPALFIRTLTSTDMGVAFYIETEGRRIYHAGDLNVWYWNDEPMEDNIASEKKCREEMQSLADHIRAEKADTDPCGRSQSQQELEGGAGKDKAPLLDIAFVPLDPRLEEHAPRCMAAFLEILDARYIFPMHYWNREEETRAYLKDARISAAADRIFFDHVKE